jgi:hypothetical protein
MRYWKCVWLLAIVVPASMTLAAQLTASGDSAGALIALEEKWVVALQRADTKTLSALWAQTYVASHRTASQ